MRIFGVFFCQRVKTGYMGVGEKCIPSDWSHMILNRESHCAYCQSEDVRENVKVQGEIHPWRSWDIEAERKPLNQTWRPGLFPSARASGLRVMAGWVLSTSCSTGLLCPVGRFMSGLTLKSLHCVSCTIIHSCVFGGHRAQIQGELVLGSSTVMVTGLVRDGLSFVSPSL
jgi:hypothetical protein